MGEVVVCEPRRGQLAWSGRPPFDFLRQAVLTKELASLASQVVWAVSRHTERALAEARGSKQGDSADFAFVEQSISGTRDDLNEQLFTYASACVHESTRHRVLGLATDKANPCSGSFQNSVISLANNKIIVCCPQAPGGSVGNPTER